MQKAFASLLILLLIGLSPLLIASCKKDATTTQPVVPVAPVVPTTPASPLSVHDNVLVLDSVKYPLDLAPAKLKAGTYVFTATGTPLNAPVGAVIVGAQGRGFLRRVTASTTSGKQTTLQTQPASLDELFSGGTLTMRSSSDSLRGGRLTSTGFSYPIAKQVVYQQSPLTLTLQNGTIALNTDWVLTAGFSNNGTVEAKVVTQGATLDGKFEFTMTAAQAATLVNRTDTLNKKPYYKDFAVYVPVVLLGVPVRIPVKARLKLYFLLQYSASIGATISRDITYTHHSAFDVGVAYANSQWQGIYNLTPTNNLVMGPRSGQATANVKMAIIPKVSFELYNAIGPYVSLGLQEELQAAVASPALDWNFQADAWLHTTVGVTGTVFGKQLPDYSTSWDTDKLTYKTPDHLERVAGDNQTGTANLSLPTPIKVRVLDSKNNPESGVRVYFTVDNGNGYAQPISVSDADGYAQSIWQLGATTTTLQHLNASAKLANGQAIKNSPLDFAATASPYCNGTPLQITGIKIYDGGPYPAGYQGSKRYEFGVYATGGVPPFLCDFNNNIPQGGGYNTGYTSLGCGAFDGRVFYAQGGSPFSLTPGKSFPLKCTVTDAMGTKQVFTTTVTY